jgi:hypothetical protein
MDYSWAGNKTYRGYQDLAVAFSGQELKEAVRGLLVVQFLLRQVLQRSLGVGLGVIC